MRILADENIERELIDDLRNAGFEVDSVRESRVGASDEDVLQFAVSTNAIVMTHDSDFGDLVFRFRLESCGVLLLRFSTLPLPALSERIIEVLTKHADELENAFTVISDHSLRIRRGAADSSRS